MPRCNTTLKVRYEHYLTVMTGSVDVWNDSVGDPFTVAVPAGAILLLALCPVPPFTMHQEDREVHRVEVRDEGHTWQEWKKINGS